MLQMFEMSSFKILVTGGAGFVGSHLALALKEKFSSSNVIALDNLKRRGSELNLSRLSQGGVEFMHGTCVTLVIWDSWSWTGSLSVQPNHLLLPGDLEILIT